MDNIWKYVEKFDSEVVIKIEKTLGIQFPSEYIEGLHAFNRGKPQKSLFALSAKKECVLDYMIDLESCVGIANNIGIKGFVPFASDPFGNYLGFNFIDGKANVSYWNHETKELVFVADSFENFLGALYEKSDKKGRKLSKQGIRRFKKVNPMR